MGLRMAYECRMTIYSRRC